MNKIFVLALLGMFAFSVASVSALSPQAATVDIDPSVVAEVLPGLLDFGSLAPGETGGASQITIDVSGSNVDVQVEVDDVTGFPFRTHLMFGAFLALNHPAWIFECQLSEEGLCVYTNQMVDPTLTVPLSAPAGTMPGVITYTVAQHIPSE